MPFQSATWHAFSNRYRSGLLQWTLIIGLGLLAGLLSSLLYYLFFTQEFSSLWWGYLTVKMIAWTVWFVMSVVILEIAARFPLRAGVTVRNLAWLFVWSLVVLGLYLGLYAVLLKLMARQPITLDHAVRSVLVSHSTYYVLAFWVVVAMENGVRLARVARERDRTTRQLQLQLEQTRLDSLHARVRPHFLFNTLNSISSLIVRGSREEANDIVVTLADLLRTSLDHPESALWPFRDELGFVRRYIDIVQQRFGDRLQLHMTVPDSALRALIPPFLLQNLVENAVKHGVEQSAEQTAITVTAACADNRLNLSVSNTIPLSPPRRNESDRTGFGLRSIRERLEAHYRHDFQFRIDQPDTHTFAVHLTLPAGLGTPGDRRDA